MDGYIRARDLSKRYRSGAGELVIFSGVDLDVAQGEMLALVGESGAGKSTLLHLLGGLDTPSSGTIHYGSREISGLASSELSDFRNRDIGFVWQIHYLLPEFTAQENVMMPLLIRGVERAQAAAESLARLDEVGLQARSSHRAGELSGGEQQRVALARALIFHPRILVMDEPLAALDVESRHSVRAFLVADLRALGRPFIVIAHHREDVRAFGAPVAVLERGRIVQRGELAALEASPASSFTAHLLNGRPGHDGPSS
jgi:lipoprotein-releasing system ATP-binding protein